MSGITSKCVSWESSDTRAATSEVSEMRVLRNHTPVRHPALAIWDLRAFHGELDGMSQECNVMKECMCA